MGPEPFAKNYQTFKKNIFGTMNEILGFLPYFYLNSEAFKIPQFKFQKFRHDARCSQIQLIQAKSRVVTRRRGSGVTDGEEWETSLVQVRGSTAVVPPTGDRSKNRG